MDRRADAGAARLITITQDEPRHDGTAEELISFLRSEGAARRGHGDDRALLDHLVGTYETVRRWNQPAQLQHAALIHSVYGTDVYRQQLLPGCRRQELASIVGDEAERLAYLFAVTPRDPLLAGTHTWAPDLPTPPPQGEPANHEPPASRAELDGLILLHMANLAEQARAADGSPGRWLVRLRELAELLIASETVTLPLFIAGLAAFSDADELLARRAYGAGIAEGDDQARANQLALAAAVCPVVPEPCLWQAVISSSRGDLPSARSWARLARGRLLDLGTAWDKRLTFDEWLQLALLLEQATDRVLSTPVGAIAEPRTLFEAVGPGRLDRGSASGAPMFAERSVASPDAAVGVRRFHRYVETFAQTDDPASRPLYPQLDSQPWYDPSEFPLAGYLESNYEAIRDEILALEAASFHRESERIQRSGDWDVAFLYERGRRRDEVCDACPVTTRGIESYPAVRTVAGLAYASRMRAGTHIQAHRGPTNLRVRCHLGIQVPDGDCAIRVGEQTEHWQAGRCLVFDDHFEHEAWNHTEQDRIVLIVDMWHPGLSDAEVRLLEGLHSYVSAYARQLNRYWSSNAAAAG
ncbi:MAG: aspartyl/asparaginyl beta-hydroxylase domain-containing protein [Solirubrobacteraceae bacterium]